MSSLSFLLESLGLLVMLSYTALLVFVIVYLAYRKYIVYVSLRDVPTSTILDIGLSKVKQNLKIDGIQLPLILSGLELLIVLLGGITTIGSDLYNAFIYNSTNQSVQTRLDQVDKPITVAANRLCMVVCTLLLPIACIFLSVEESIPQPSIHTMDQKIHHYHSS